MARYVTDDFKLREKYQSQRLSRHGAETWLRTNHDWQSCIQGQAAKRHLAELDPLAALAADCVIDSLPVLGPGDQVLLVEQNGETPKALRLPGDTAK
jgi:hypothetical protein